LPSILTAFLEMWYRFETDPVGDSCRKGFCSINTIKGYRSHVKKYLEFCWIIFELKKIKISDKRNVMDKDEFEKSTLFEMFHYMGENNELNGNRVRCSLFLLFLKRVIFFVTFILEENRLLM
jgi:hypothetical protein